MFVDKVGPVKSALSSLEKLAKERDEKVQALTLRSVDNIQEDVGEIKSTVGRLDSKMDVVDNKIDVVDKKVDTKISGMIHDVQDLKQMFLSQYPRDDRSDTRPRGE